MYNDREPSPADYLALVDGNLVKRAAALDGLAHDLHKPIGDMLRNLACECRRDAELLAHANRTLDADRAPAQRRSIRRFVASLFTDVAAA